MDRTTILFHLLKVIRTQQPKKRLNYLVGETPGNPRFTGMSEEVIFQKKGKDGNSEVFLECLDWHSLIEMTINASIAIRKIYSELKANKNGIDSIIEHKILEIFLFKLSLLKYLIRVKNVCYFWDEIALLVAGKGMNYNQSCDEITSERCPD